MPSVCSYLYGLFFIRVSSSSRVYYFHPWEFNSLTMNQQISYLSPCQDKDIYMNCLCWLGRGGGYELLLNSLISFRNISYRVFIYFIFYINICTRSVVSTYLNYAYLVHNIGQDSRALRCTLLIKNVHVCFLLLMIN